MSGCVVPHPRSLVALCLLCVALYLVLRHWGGEDHRGGLAVSGFGGRRRTSDLSVARTLSVPSGLRCDRIQLPARFFNESTGPYNPGAVRHPRTGEWLVVYTFDECWYRICEYAKSGEDLEGRMRSHPLLLRLGFGEEPDFGLAETSVHVLELDDSFQRMTESYGEDIYKAADWRPFAWRGEVYLGHWTAFVPIEERMSISRLDLDALTVRFVHRFHKLSPRVEQSQRLEGEAHAAPGGLFPKPPPFRREKNWGFAEEGDKLLIYYSLLPCVVVLEFRPGSNPDGMVMRERLCYDAQAPALERATGLDMVRYEMHSSGHPVPWDADAGERHHTLVSMLHVRHGDYAHWAVLLDRRTHAVTHVSAGPLLKSTDYRNEGFLDTALVVTSFYVVDRWWPDARRAERVLRVFYGEGDRFGCYLDIKAANIVWHKLAAPVPDSSLPQWAEARLSTRHKLTITADVREDVWVGRREQQ